MTSSKKTQSKRLNKETKSLYLNKDIYQLSKFVLGIRSPEDLIQRLNAQLFGGVCRISDVRVVKLNPARGRLMCERTSTKVEVLATSLTRLKDLADNLVKGNDKFDCLLVSAMWTNGAGEWRTYHCAEDNTTYVYFPITLRGYSGQPVVINFNFFGIKERYWIEINCPDNLLSAYSSGRISFKGGTVERELPWVCEKQPTGPDFELTM